MKGRAAALAVLLAASAACTSSGSVASPASLLPAASTTSDQPASSTSSSATATSLGAVLFLGDSLTVGADEYGDLEALAHRAGFDGVDVIAEEGRDTPWAIARIEALEVVDPVVVVELGTNRSAAVAGFDSQVRVLVDDLRRRGATRIAWLTPVDGRDDRYQQKDDVLRDADGIDRVADWATVVHADQTHLAADGLHPTREAYPVLARFLVATAVAVGTH